MELRHFRYFVGVAEELSFSRAARRLNVSQPPLTQAIIQLEEELGIRLFNRTSRKVELTEAGTLFLSRARGILAQVNRVTSDMQSLGKTKKAVLRLGLTRAIMVLGDTMKGFRDRYPDIHLDLVPSVGRTPQDFLMDDEADVNIGEYHPPDTHLDSRLWAKLNLQTLVPDSHPLATRDRIGIEELRAQPLLLPGLSNPMHMGREALKFCREKGFFEPNLVRHCDDMEIFFALVSSGAGVGIIQTFYLTTKPKSLRSIPFLEPTPELEIGVVWRRDRTSAALLDLIDDLETNLRSRVGNIPGSVTFTKKSESQPSPPD